MESLQKLVTETKDNSIEVGYEYEIYVTHVNNPLSFYVRPRDYTKYLYTLQTRGERLSKTEIKIGDVVIYKSKVTKSFIRGKVIFTEGEDNFTCDLIALDIGCLENCIPIQKIWKPMYNVNVPALATHCQLYNCIPLTEKWKEDTIKAMKDYILGKPAKIVVKDIVGEIAVVQLSTNPTDDLSTLLAITKHANIPENDDLSSHFIIYCDVAGTYPERIIQVKSVLRVRLQFGSFLDKFHVAQIDEYKAFSEVLNEYTAYAEKQKPLKLDQLKVNIPVFVLYDRNNKYERGLLKKIIADKNHVRVELVDWGKVIVVPIDTLRPIPEKYYQDPPVAICCSLHVSQYGSMGLPEIKQMANLSYPGIEFCIKFEEVPDNADSPNLVTVFKIKTN